MYKQVILVRTDIRLSKGKLAVQVAHASLEAYRLASKAVVRKWQAEGTKKVVLAVPSLRELKQLFSLAVKRGFPVSIIRDAGRTELRPGTMTCVGIGPVVESEIDTITRKLKLLK